MKTLRTNWFPVLIFIACAFAVLHEIKLNPASETGLVSKDSADHIWRAPTIASLGNDSSSQLILYGRELIAHTAKYFGPHGMITSITNGMNCQNCHINAGVQPYGNCFSAVASTYPVFRARSGIKESVEYRINDCFQRSLNGNPIDSLGKEMRAMVAYLEWLGKEVPKGTRPPGAGLTDLPLLDRAAEPLKGKIIYDAQCSRCHGDNGQGQPRFDNIEYSYPPLWGPDSYNTGAGLYRVSRLAAYVHDNMPFGIATHENPQLNDAEAWDVAAFISSQARPVKQFPEDWPVIAKKSFDYPFGPYADGFSEQQHKYGPFAPVKKAIEQITLQKK